MTRIELHPAAPGAPLFGALTALAAAAALACSSSSGPSGPTGGPVSGALDTHCGSGSSVTAAAIGVCVTDEPPANASRCGVTFQAPGTTGAGASGDDGGAPADDAGAMSDYGDTLYNASGFDDDCKYAVSWTATPIRVGAGVTFTVSVMRLTDMKPAECASTRAEVFLTDTHPVASPSAPPPESPPGTYAVGPIKFDEPGIWTVRFHFYETCVDTPDSPHGHAAFFVNVPDPNHPDAASTD